MTVTLILRVLPGPLAERELVGHAELVATGVSVPFRGLDDLLALAQSAAVGDAGRADDADTEEPDSNPAIAE